MKTTKNIMAVLLIALASVSLSQAAELANPAPGSVVRYYNWKSNTSSTRSIHDKVFLREFPRCLSGEIAPAEVKVDTAEDFGTLSPENRRIAVWDGYLKSTSGGPFVLTFGFVDPVSWESVFSAWVNGQQLVQGDARSFSGRKDAFAFNVNLQPGFNSIRIVFESHARCHLSLAYKKDGSLQAARNIGPGDLWHEDVVEDEEW